MNVMDARLCLQLHRLPGLADLPLARLFRHYGCSRKIWDSDPRTWPQMGVPQATVDAAIDVQRGVARKSDLPKIEQQLNFLREIDAEVIVLTDPRYPVLLQLLYDPPPILYVRGEHSLLQQAQVGIVGARKASSHGRRAAHSLAAELVHAGLHICSGLAAGIDQAAHRGALDAGGKTLAVMATGLDVIYPARHRGLAEEISLSGCLLSEFPPGCRPLRQRFPRRNRVISGLSLGVLVVEAAQRSGSLITARTAMEQGREVFALPWSMFHTPGQGCLGLIKDGVKMVLRVEDILEELGPLYQCQREALNPAASEPAADTGLSAAESGVLDLIGSEAVSVDELVSHSGLAVSRILAVLSTLEIGGRVVRDAGGYIQS
ncbi:MAG: DNA-processing protein DprA [Halioglobus sp.]